LTQANGQVVERLIFIVQVTKTGEVFTDRDEKNSPVVLERIRKFPIKAGHSEARDGKAVFPDAQRAAAGTEGNEGRIIEEDLRRLREDKLEATRQDADLRRRDEPI